MFENSHGFLVIAMVQWIYGLQGSRDLFYWTSVIHGLWGSTSMAITCIFCPLVLMHCGLLCVAFCLCVSLYKLLKKSHQEKGSPDKKFTKVTWAKVKGLMVMILVLTVGLTSMSSCFIYYTFNTIPLLILVFH